MEYFIVGDIHLKVDFVEKALAIAGETPIIWLGDFFDDYDDEPSRAEKMAWKLRNVIGDRWRADTFLLGNHELPYRYQTAEKYRGWGWREDKSNVINSILQGHHWSKFEIFKEIQFRGKPLIFSHAGFEQRFLSNGTWDSHFMRRCQRDVLERSIKDPNPWLDSEFGPLWTRRLTLGLFAPPDINQIVGHTHTNTPFLKNLGENFVANFDCAPDYIGYINDENLFVVNVHTKEKTELLK